MNDPGDPPAPVDPSAANVSLDAPVFSALMQHAIDPRSVKLLGEGFCRKKHTVILGEVDPEGRGPITVGMLDPEDQDLVRRLHGFLQRPIEPVRLDAEAIAQALDIGHGRHEPAPGQASLELLADRPPVSATERKAQTMIDALLLRAIALGARAVHIERRGAQIVVRVRVDGALHPLSASLSAPGMDAVLARLTTLLREEHPAAPGRLRGRYGPPERQRPVEVQVSVSPDRAQAVLQLRGTDARPRPLLDLGLPADRLPRIESLLRCPEGLLLITGPAGHGRTTTLYSLLGMIEGPSRKILSVEDPIEHRFETIGQVEIDPAMGFAAHTRAFLSQDPDVIAVGELDDAATAEVATRAAEVGCMVLGSVRARDAVGALARLHSLGLALPRLAEQLLGVLAQRLLPRLCEACREVAPDDAFAEAAFARLGRRFAHARARGCEQCHGTGHVGRIAIFEWLEVDTAIAESMAGDPTARQLRSTTRAVGMRTLYEMALWRAEQHEISLEEVRRGLPRQLIDGAAPD